MERTKDLLGRIELTGGASGCQKYFCDIANYKTEQTRQTEESARLDIAGQRKLTLWDTAETVATKLIEAAEETVGTFEPIYSYSRAQAIEDGILVDLMQDELKKTVIEAGFKFPVAMTSAAFSETISPIDGGELPAGQDIQGRLWDVLTMLKHAIKTDKSPGSQVNFSLSVMQHNNKHKVIGLKSVCGAGDTGEPVITIMLPDED